MEIIGAISIGVTIGVLAGLRVIRSPLTFVLIVAAVIAIFGFMAVRANGPQAPAGLAGVVAVIYMYGVGFLWFMAVPGAAAFGAVALVRRNRAPPTNAPRRPSRKLTFTWLGATALGCIYLLYGIGLLVASRDVGGSVMLRNAGPNFPILSLMLMVGLEQPLSTSLWLEGIFFIVGGTAFYAALGAGAGFVADSWRASHVHVAS